MVQEENWSAGRWWRVLDPFGKLWMETSNEQEARKAVLKPGYTLERLYTYTKSKWMEQT